MNTSLVLGHGLQGVLPRIPGTFFALSIWVNDVSGHLPELRLQSRSLVLAHSNKFSCGLPQNGFTKPAFSMALLGNRFTQPAVFPRWIQEEEQGILFCVSNKDGQELVAKLSHTACLLSISIAVATFRRRQKGRRPRLDQLRDVKAAWYDMANVLSLCALGSSLMILLYSIVDRLSCTMVLQRMQFPALASHEQMHKSVVVANSVWLCYTAARFNSRHSRRGWVERRRLHISKHDTPRMLWEVCADGVSDDKATSTIRRRAQLAALFIPL
eukprot:218169-Amphidinium_carterae.2